METLAGSGTRRRGGTPGQDMVGNFMQYVEAVTTMGWGGRREPRIEGLVAGLTGLARLTGVGLCVGPGAGAGGA